MPATLGVLGGMGPAATAEFLRLLAVRVPARTDQEHPRIVLLSEPSVPDRTEALLAGEDTPLRPIGEGLRTLVSWGADLLAVPCNTAHVFIDRLRLPVPVVHIVDATLRQARRASPSGAWLTATTGTVTSGLYQERAAELGYPLLVPSAAWQQRIHRAASLVKANRTGEGAEVFAAVLAELWRRDGRPVVAACTELPIAHTAAGLPPASMVSSLDALATACAEQLYRAVTPLRIAG